jgi:ankyrin repeat protein
MFAARSGDLPSTKLLVAAGANVNDCDAWGVSATVLAAQSDFSEVVEFLLERGADPNLAAAGFTALHEAIMHRDERMAGTLLAHGADPNAPLRTWTPTRRSSHDFNFAPDLVGATPFWLAARFDEPGVMRMLLERGADARFVHHGDHVVAERGGKGDVFQHHADVTTPLMAALGMGGGVAWAQPARNQRETLTLESVKLALDSGADVNAANTDGRTALDAAKALRYESVVKFLTEKGARPGSGAKPRSAETRDPDK